MTTRFLRRFVSPRLLPFVLASLVAARAHAQAGVLTGRVLDTTGAPIAGAGIRIPQLERAETADSAGFFRITGLPAGRVTVIGEAAGYFGARTELTVPVSGTVEHDFSLRPNAHVLAGVEIRARARQNLPPKLAEFAIRQHRGAGRFLTPDQLERFNGQPLTEALKTILVGARFQRSQSGELTIISGRSLNPSSLRPSYNARACGVQIWQDGVLISDPNASADLVLEPSSTSRQVTTAHVGLDKEWDISGLLANSYMAAEYYSDLATTPPGFRTGTETCGVLVLWTREPMRDG